MTTIKVVVPVDDLKRVEQALAGEYDVEVQSQIPVEFEAFLWYRSFAGWVFRWTGPNGVHDEARADRELELDDCRAAVEWARGKLKAAGLALK